MKRKILNAVATISLALALSGCIIAPWHHHDGGYGGGYNNGGYNGGGPGPGPGPGYYHNGY
jgi:hypothetical protein